MNRLKIILAGVERGPFSQEIIRQYLEEGILLSTDSAQLEGQDSWTTVSEALSRAREISPPIQYKRKRRKTSHARQKARRRRLFVGFTYVSLIGSLILAFIFQDKLLGLYNLFNFMLYQQWITIAL